MKLVKRMKSPNFILYLSLFIVTQVTGLLLSLSICFILQDFIWGFLRMSMINSFILGISLICCCLLSQNLIFKMKTLYIILISVCVLLGTGIVSLMVLLYSEPTLFIYYNRGAISFLFVNFLFIMALYIISSGLIVYREIMIEKEKAIGNERAQKNEMKEKLLASLEEHNRTLETKVADRTQELHKKNSELEDTLNQLKQMQNQVIVQEKMATLGQLVAGLTHEINTPISAIRSMNDTKSKAVTKLQRAVESIAPDTAENEYRVRDVMDVILKADQLIDQGTERLHEIIKNLKNFVRLDEAGMKKVDIHEGLDSTLALLSHDMLTNIEVVREYSEIPPFMCHPRELNQVFLNIVKNACQAIEDKGKITITTSVKKNKAHVAIRDTGRGIKQGDLKSIFDPGFTSKKSAVRASLGLSVCYQIVQEHRGKIDVQSQPGKGSVFTVILPMDLKNEPAVAS